MIASPPSDFTAVFLRKDQLTADTYSFFFAKPNPQWSFIPGQYVRMTLSIDNPDIRGTARFFTISSSPLSKDYFVITTRIIQSSFKKTLVALTPKTQVRFFGPTGGFILKEEESSPHIFLAGGIGITPFHCMITYAAEKKLSIPLSLFVSFSKPEEIIFQKELEDIAKNNVNIKIVYTITRPEESSISWQGEVGRISPELIQKYTQDTTNALYYIAGPPHMVSAIVEMVKAMGVDITRIKKENFVGY